MSTCFPEAVPLTNIKAQNIVKVLMRFFTFVGLPRSIQSDQGSNFTSSIFQQVICQINSISSTVTGSTGKVPSDVKEYDEDILSR